MRSPSNPAGEVATASTSALRPAAEMAAPAADLTIAPLRHVSHRIRMALLLTCGCGLMLSGWGFNKSRGFTEYIHRFTDSTSGW